MQEKSCSVGCLRALTRSTPTNYEMLLFRTLNPLMKRPAHNADDIAPILRDHLLPVRCALCTMPSATRPALRAPGDVALALQASPHVPAAVRAELRVCQLHELATQARAGAVLRACAGCRSWWLKHVPWAKYQLRAALENRFGVPGCINFIDARTKWFDAGVVSAVGSGTIKQVSCCLAVCEARAHDVLRVFGGGKPLGAGRCTQGRRFTGSAPVARLLLPGVQVVVLAAGFDTRSLRFAPPGGAVKFFEVRAGGPSLSTSPAVGRRAAAIAAHLLKGLAVRLRRVQVDLPGASARKAQLVQRLNLVPPQVRDAPSFPAPHARKPPSRLALAVCYVAQSLPRRGRTGVTSSRCACAVRARGAGRAAHVCGRRPVQGGPGDGAQGHGL